MINETAMDIEQLLTFNLGDEAFALSIKDVREVIEVKGLTRLPQTPAFMRGVINLRGQVVPVIDLKRKFELGETEFTIDSCIIIIEVVIDNEISILGALADGVQDVIEVPTANIEPAPKIGSSVDNNYIYGITKGKEENEFIVILNKSKLFTLSELTLTKAIEEQSDEGQQTLLIDGDENYQPE